jgi:hypothetical protein
LSSLFINSGLEGVSRARFRWSPWGLSTPHSNYPTRLGDQVVVRASWLPAHSPCAKKRTLLGNVQQCTVPNQGRLGQVSRRASNAVNHPGRLDLRDQSEFQTLAALGKARTKSGVFATDLDVSYIRSSASQGVSMLSTSSPKLQRSAAAAKPANGMLQVSEWWGQQRWGRWWRRRSSVMTRESRTGGGYDDWKE